MAGFDWSRWGERTALRIVLVMTDGPALKREWTWQQLVDGEAPGWIHDGPPSWLLEPEMLWRDPLLPIEVRGHVPEGMQEQAYDLLLHGRGG